MKKLLITWRLPEIAQQILTPHFAVTAIDKNEPLPAEKLLEAVQTYDVILATIPDKFTREVLDQAKTLEVISNYAVGLDNIDLDYAQSKGIAVYNTPGIVTASTADLTMTLFLALARQIFPARDFVRTGKWEKWDPEFFLGAELYDKTFGIIGFGRIGQAVAKRALGFDMKVLYYNHRPVNLTDDYLRKNVRSVSLDELLQESDYISLHVPLTEKTKGMVNADLIKKMAKKPILLNLARGGVINSDDLAEALQTGQIKGAGLDVTDPEPIPADHPLCQLENCIIVPHIGTATKECRYQMAKIAAENILKHFGLNS